MKKLFQNKGIGFYFEAVLALLSIVTAIIYAVSYGNFVNQATNNKPCISWVGFVFLFAWIVLAVILKFTKFGKYTPYLDIVFIELALFFYVYRIYYYVSVMAAGIDASFNFTFFFITILFVILAAIAIANCFLPQEKASEEND